MAAFLPPLLLTILLSPGLHADSCRARVRALVDLGSGTAKITLAEVEVCTASTRLLRVLETEISVPVPLEAGKDPDGALTPAVLDSAEAALKNLKEQAVARARALRPGLAEIEFAAAGTHAFRSATNRELLARRLSALGLDVVALTQEQEALAGLSAVRAPECADRRLLVWDIGGGSMQLTLGGQTPAVTGLPLGAESFKRRLLSELAIAGSSPNPLGANGIKALALAEREAAALPSSLKQGELCAVGIGGVHSKAIAAQVEKLWPRLSGCVCGAKHCRHAGRSYTRRELECLASHLSGKSDSDPELSGPYASTGVSNIYLVLGFMRALGLEQVHTQNINMGLALATDRKLLKFRTEPVGAKANRAAN